MGWNYLSIPKLERGKHWSLGIVNLFHPTLYWACDYLSMLGLKIHHVGKGVPVIWMSYSDVAWTIAILLLQYIPRNMHTVFALLCFVVVIHWLISPYPSGLLHWHCGNLTIVPVPAKQPWWIWINTSCEFIMNDCITTTKQSTTKPCAYFLGYTVHFMALTVIMKTLSPLALQYLVIFWVTRFSIVLDFLHFMFVKKNFEI